MYGLLKIASMLAIVGAAVVSATEGPIVDEGYPACELTTAPYVTGTPTRMVCESFGDAKTDNQDTEDFVCRVDGPNKRNSPRADVFVKKDDNQKNPQFFKIILSNPEKQDKKVISFKTPRGTFYYKFKTNDNCGVRGGAASQMGDWAADQVFIQDAKD